MKLLLFLLVIGGGAIVNVAVAWGFDLHDRSFTYDRSLKLLECTVRSSDSQEELAPTSWVIRSGWPCQSMTLHPWIAWEAFLEREERITWQGGILVVRKSSPGSETGAFFPLRPILPGFAINTILYAASLWILFATPGALSRKRRLRRGQCVACGYSLRGRGNTTRECPECGATPFKQKAERAKVES